MSSIPLREIWRKDLGLRCITIGWTGFILENLILSENRDYLIQTFGKDTYHGVYGGLSTIACASFLFGYVKHRNFYKLAQKANINSSSQQLLEMPYWPPGGRFVGRSAGLVLQCIGAVGMMQPLPKLQIPVGVSSSSARDHSSGSSHGDDGGGSSSASSASSWMPAFSLKCPVEWKASRDAQSGQVQGMHRVCREPLLWSFGILGFGTALRSNAPAAVAMYSFPLIFAAIGSAHKDSRYYRGRQENPLTPEEENQTSWLPFGAVVTGQQRLEDIVKETKVVNGLVGIGVLAATLL